MYGCDAQMNFFEAGHGKSACDGIGGTTKRMVDEASRQGKSLIQGADDLQLGPKHNYERHKILVVYVDKAKCEAKQELFSNLNIKPVKNTMKVHAIALCATDKVFKTRTTSCYCTTCITGRFCESWIEEKCEWVDVQSRSDIEMQEQQVTPVEVSENAVRNAKSADNNVIKVCENKMQEQQVILVEVSENAECNAKSAEDNVIKVGEKKKTVTKKIEQNMKQVTLYMD
ncbi:hypothetical protein DPMN_065311 [Dreissena polymorpha]|uniref:Uncharacterized protein n=1 Tax=Dreissena polymorpha TaxID=45954 RepID=A0A9D4CFA2_DREPO|nr:hypothetical protein DPMN_065311 [Dreissena polymorpha]